MAKTTKKTRNPTETQEKFYLSHKYSPKLFCIFPLPKNPKEFSAVYFRPPLLRRNKDGSEHRFMNIP